MKTLKFEIVTGVNKGYFHENESQATEKKIGSVWQEIAKEQMEQSELYISVVVSKSNTVYHTDWGCPKGGEDTFTITSTANPAFVKDLEQWKTVVLNCTKELKKKLSQSTITVEFTEVSDFVYLTEEKDKGNDEIEELKKQLKVAKLEVETFKDNYNKMCKFYKEKKEKNESLISDEEKKKQKVRKEIEEIRSKFKNECKKNNLRLSLKGYEIHTNEHCGAYLNLRGTKIVLSKYSWNQYFEEKEPFSEEEITLSQAINLINQY